MSQSSLLHINMPDYITRRDAFDAFDALLKPQVPHPDDFYLSWEKPERFSCDCCGFPVIMNPGRYEMCTLCEWEEENYAIDTNYGGEPNGSYMLFDSRKHFEKHGCMYLPEEDYTDFERNTTLPVMDAKRKLIRACLHILKLQKDTPELHIAWEQVLRCQIDLTNTKHASHITYEELYEKLHYRHYSVAVCKDNDRGYQAILPDFPDFSPDSGVSEDHAFLQVKRGFNWHIQALKQKGLPIAEPKPLQEYQCLEAFQGYTWFILHANKTGV